jgi:hypothetical protein
MFQQGYISDQAPLEKHEAIAKVVEETGELLPETHGLADLIFDTNSKV